MVVQTQLTNVGNLLVTKDITTQIEAITVFDSLFYRLFRYVTR